MERQNFNFKVKSLDDTGSFVGLGAAYNNVDLGGDKILPGAFARTIASQKSYPLLWQHDPSLPVGSARISDSPQGLQVQGQLLLSDPTAQKAYQFLKAGIIKGLSIGFETLQESFEDGVRLLKELRLWELSIVTFPMNESALVTGIKGMSADDQSKHLKAIDEHRRAIDRHQRGMRMNLKALLGGDFADDTDDPEEPEDDPDMIGINDTYDDPEGMSWLVGELKSLTLDASMLAPDI